MNTGRAGAGQQGIPNEDLMRGAASGAGAAAGAHWAQQQAESQRNYIDPPLLGHQTPSVVTYDQCLRLKSYDAWDGDMRWPHPQFQKDEAERAKNYNNRQQVGYLRDQAQISAYQRQIAENQAAIEYLRSQNPRR